MATQPEAVDQLPRRNSVFLCHAKEDEVEVLKVYEALNEHGFAPWIDCMDLLPGQNWEEEIPRVIEASDFMLVFLSGNSVQKRGYVQKEFRLAEEVHGTIPQGKLFLIPVLLSPCDVPPRFARLHYAKLYERDGMTKLLKSLGHTELDTKPEGQTSVLGQLHELNRQARALEMTLLELPEAFRSLADRSFASETSGIIKLLPRGLYSQVMRLAGGGAYYSFSRRTAEYGHGSDIELQGDTLMVGFAGMDYGFFVPLATGSLDQLIRIDEAFPEWCPAEVRSAWDYAWNYQSPAQRVEVRHAFRNFRDGKPIGQVVAMSHIAFSIGRILLLRSFNYNGRPGDDVLVALFCAERLADGSAVLAWKLLRQQKAVFPEGPDETH